MTFAQQVIEPQGVWQLLDKGGTIALAGLIIVAFVRGWIVPRWAYVDLKDRCAQISSLAERATELAERNAAASEELKRRRRSTQDGQ